MSDVSKQQITTVQELFKAADTDRVIDAYILTRPIVYDYEDISMEKKFKRLDSVRNAIKYNIGMIQDYVPSETDDVPKTIFIVKYDMESWEDIGKKDFDCFYFEDEYIKERIKENLDDELVFANKYGVDFLSVGELVNCNVAKYSIKKYGIETCCALILYEFFEFGYTEEKRKENIDKLYKRIDEADKEIESGNTKSLTSDELFKEMLDFCNDEDEKQHMLLEMEYQDSVEEIECRHMRKVVKKNNKKMLKMLKEEYC